MLKLDSPASSISTSCRKGFNPESLWEGFPTPTPLSQLLVGGVSNPDTSIEDRAYKALPQEVHFFCRRGSQHQTFVGGVSNPDASIEDRAYKALP